LDLTEIENITIKKIGRAITEADFKFKIPDDFERGRLPDVLYRYKDKMFGLTISAERLAEVRHQRRPGSRYASLETCRMEVNEAEAMMKREGIQWLSTTTRSIEEIATNVLTLLDLE
jgi:regulator of PEP synthase PpsR (kinase-PPPase family)